MESAKSRRFVLIPIEKLELSRVGHDSNDVVSLPFRGDAVDGSVRSHNDTARRVPHAGAY